MRRLQELTHVYVVMGLSVHLTPSSSLALQLPEWISSSRMTSACTPSRFPGSSSSCRLIACPYNTQFAKPCSRKTREKQVLGPADSFLWQALACAANSNAGRNTRRG